MSDAGTNTAVRRVLELLRRLIAEYRRISAGGNAEVPGRLGRRRRKRADPSRGATSRSRRRSAGAGRADGAVTDGSSGTVAEPIGDVDRLRVSYEPQRDGEADPGEVVWAWVPYEDDPDQGKDRPVLIIGRVGSRLAGVPLSTTDRNGGAYADEWMTLGSGPWDSRGRTSHAHISRLLAFDANEIRREGAALDRERFDEVVEAVRTFGR